MMRVHPHLSLWRLASLVILSTAAAALALRCVLGLGAVTHLSEAHPWGIWFGLNVLCGVGLAAGGFAAATICFAMERGSLKPLANAAALLACAGYFCAGFALEVRMGRPWRIWRPEILENPASPLFAATWGLVLCLTILVLQYCWLSSERAGNTRFASAARRAVIVLAGLGFVLAAWHQLSLGGLFAARSGGIHPLWDSRWLPLFLLLSAIPAGLAALILVGETELRTFGVSLEQGVFPHLARWTAFLCTAFVLLRFADLGTSGALGLLGFSLPGTLEANLFWLEVALFAAPIILYVGPSKLESAGRRFVFSSTAIGGFMAYGLNVAVTSLDFSAPSRYFPSWVEVSIALGAVLAAYLFFRALARRILGPADRQKALEARA